MVDGYGGEPGQGDKLPPRDVLTPLLGVRNDLVRSVTGDEDDTRQCLVPKGWTSVNVESPSGLRNEVLDNNDRLH
jgi:hypothetical protein